MIYKQSKLIVIMSIFIMFAVNNSFAKDMHDKQKEKEKEQIKASIKNKTNNELLRLMEDSNPSVAFVASELLGERKDSSVVTDLMKLLESENRKVSQLAAISLGEIGDAKAVEALIEVFNKAKPKGDKIIPLAALCKINDPKSYDFVESNIDNTSYDLALSDPRARSLGLLQDSYIEMKLKGLSEENKLKMLINILKNKKMYLVITGKIVKVGKVIIPDLLKVVKDKHNSLLARNTALTCIGGIKDERWVMPLTEILVDETEDDKIRDFTARLLGMSKDKRAIPALEKAIKGWKPRADDKNVVITKTGERKYLYNVKETAEKALKNINKY